MTRYWILVNLLILALAVFLLLPDVTVFGQGSGTINQLQQWRATSTPDAITQSVAGKAIKITGLNDGCIELVNGLATTTTGLPCGSGGGGGGGGYPTYFQNGGATLNSATTTVVFTPNSFSITENPTDTLTIRVSTTTLGLLTTDITEGSKLFYTDARARAALSETITGLAYDSGTGAFSLDSGYFLPTTTRATNWDTAFSWGNHASQGYITDGNTDWDNSYGFITGNQTITLSGDASGSGETSIAVTVSDDSHAHTGSTLSGIDISDDTNLAADGTEIVLTGDSLSLGNSLTFTYATATNLAATNIGLFGNTLVTTANDLCIQLTGSADLCDGSDGGGGGSGSDVNWTALASSYLRPATSTYGISVAASSTIGGGTGTTGLTVNGNASTSLSSYIGGNLSVGTSTTDNLINVDGAAVSNNTDLIKITAPSGYSGGGGSYINIVDNSNTQKWAINSFGNMTVKNGSTFTGTAGTAPANGLAVFSPTGSQNGLTIKGGASYTGDYIRILDNSNNTLLNFSGTTTFLGIGSSSPTRMLTVGGDIFTPSNISAASSTITNATSTTLFSALANFTTLFGVNASTTNLLATNATTSNLAILNDITLQASSTVVNLVETVGFTVDGGSSVISTGIKGYIEVPYDATIVGWTALSTDASVTTGTTTIDIYKDSYANYPPDSSDSIFTSTKVNILGSTKGQSTSTPSNNIVTEGDILGFNVDSVSALKRVTVILKLKRR